MQRDHWRFDFEGREYRYRGYVTAPDAILIKKHTGMTVTGFLNGIATGDPESLVGMVFLAKRQAGEKVLWDELVESMVGENDLLALVDTFMVIDDETEPATSVDLAVPAGAAIEDDVTEENAPAA